MAHQRRREHSGSRRSSRANDPVTLADPPPLTRSVRTAYPHSRLSEMARRNTVLLVVFLIAIAALALGTQHIPTMASDWIIALVHATWFPFALLAAGAILCGMCLSLVLFLRRSDRKPRRHPRHMREVPLTPRLLHETAPIEHTDHGDPLRYSRFIAVIADLILASARSAPFAISIEAEWGMGKTTAMRLLRDMLDGRLYLDGQTWRRRAESANHFSLGKERWRCYTIWFNAWKYRGSNVQAGMIAEVQLALRDLGVNALERVFGTSSLPEVAQMATDLVASATRNGQQNGSVLGALDLLVRYRNQVETDAQRALGSFPVIDPEAHSLIVIFVDDLDRCMPSEVASILEMLKLFFDVPNCVFVLGFDPWYVARSIQKDYQDIIGDGLDYLKKILQLNYALPQPDEPAMREFIADCVVEAGLDDFFEVVQRECDDGDYLQVILDGTGRNPREIKRFINALAVSRRVVGESLRPPGDGDYLTLCLLVLLQIHWPRVYRDVILRGTLTDTLESQLDELYANAEADLLSTSGLSSVR